MNIYKIITDRIINQLKLGVIPWVKPWQTEFAKNLVTKREYKGINAWLLYGIKESPYWLTFKQAKMIGGNIRKGEHGLPVVYWSILKETKNGIEKTIPLLRYYTVFNASQCENIKLPPVEEKSALKVPSDIVAGMPNPPRIVHENYNRAFYNPHDDIVNVPAISRFNDAESYYAVLFHELAHSTGNSKRLNRRTLTETKGFGSQEYSNEELIAELSSSMLCAKSGIQKTLSNSAAYIKGWLVALNNDERLIISAAGKSAKACDYILNESESLTEEV
jgi:antirestriction protein ArdC